MWQAIIGGVSLGLISSLHCVGMCGPLAMLLPVNHPENNKRLFGILSYNVGRVVSYSIIGAIFGFVGRGLYLSGMQQWFSILLGILVFLLGLIHLFSRYINQPKFLSVFYNFVYRLINRFRNAKGLSGQLVFGMANGLLPCGMVYLATTIAITTDEISQSIFFMMSFGAGTIPAMLALGYYGLKIRLSLRLQLRKLMPFMVIATAVLLILRGMNLGIPFVSPFLTSHQTATVPCHK